MPWADKPEACRGCPAYEWGVGYVPGRGPKDARIALVGQGPGETEAEYGVPFDPRAPAGAKLSAWIYKAGTQRSAVYLDNLVRCWLPAARNSAGYPEGNREPTHAEAQSCWERHVGPELRGMVAAGTLRRIVALGAPAGKFLLGTNKSVEGRLGSTLRVELPTLGGTDASDE